MHDTYDCSEAFSYQILKLRDSKISLLWCSVQFSKLFIYCRGFGFVIFPEGGHLFLINFPSISLSTFLHKPAFTFSVKTGPMLGPVLTCAKKNSSKWSNSASSSAERTARSSSKSRLLLSWRVNYIIVSERLLLLLVEFCKETWGLCFCFIVLDNGFVFFLLFQCFNAIDQSQRRIFHWLRQFEYLWRKTLWRNICRIVVRFRHGTLLAPYWSCLCIRSFTTLSTFRF